MKKKIIVLALLPFMMSACHDNHRRAYNKDRDNVYYSTGYAPFIHSNYHSHVFYPVMYMSGGHYYHGGYDSPTARSYYSSSNAAASKSTMYSTAAYAKSSGFSSKSTFSGSSVSRGGFGRSGRFSSAS